MEYVGIFGSIFYTCICAGLNLSYVFGFPAVSKHFSVVLMVPVLIELVRLIVLMYFFNFETPQVIFLKIIKDSNKGDNESPLLGKAFIFKNFMIILKESTEDSFGQNKQIGRLRNAFYYEEHHEEFTSMLYSNLLKQYQTSNSESHLIENIYLPVRLALTKKYRKQFVMALILNFLNQATGVNVFAVYSSDLFEFIGFESTAKVITIILGNQNLCKYITIYFLNQ